MHEGHSKKQDDKRGPLNSRELLAEHDDREQSCGKNLQLVGHLWEEDVGDNESTNMYSDLYPTIRKLLLQSCEVKEYCYHPTTKCILL